MGTCQRTELLDQRNSWLSLQASLSLQLTSVSPSSVLEYVSLFLLNTHTVETLNLFCVYVSLSCFLLASTFSFFFTVSVTPEMYAKDQRFDVEEKWGLCTL